MSNYVVSLMFLLPGYTLSIDFHTLPPARAIVGGQNRTRNVEVVLRGIYEISWSHSCPLCVLNLKGTYCLMFYV